MSTTQERPATERSGADGATDAGVAPLIERVLGGGLPIAVEAYDGTRSGPEDAEATIVVRSPDAIRRVLTAPGELGLARAYVAGDLELRGSIDTIVTLRERLPGMHISAADRVALLRLVGTGALRPLPPPPEEVRLRGRRHSKERDAAAIAHHYDVSNAFYQLVLGSSMTYSCAVWSDPSITLEAAQA